MGRTAWFIVAFAAVLGIYDTWTLAANGYDTTVSWVLYSKSKQWPVIPFSIGFLMGHVFMPNRAVK